MGNSFGQGNVKVGSVEVHSRVAVAEQYDDNIFWEPSDKKQDWITILSPGIRFDLPFKAEQHLLSLDYYADIAWFNEFSSQNYQNHYITSLLDLDFNNWCLNFKDKFTPQTSDRADTEFTARIKRRENNFNALFSKEFNKLSFDVSYDNFLVRYNESDLKDLDRIEQVGTLTGYTQILPKTRALLEYNYSDISYSRENERNGYYNQLRIGLEGRPTNKMTLMGKVGYQARQYRDEGESDWDHVAAYVDLIERFTDRTTLILNYLLTAAESTYSMNNYYQQNNFSAELRQRIFTKFTAYVGGYYGQNDYPDVTTEGSQTAKRRDKIWTAKAGLRYDIKEWIFAQIEYNYRDRDSNLDLLDYVDNNVQLSVSAEF